jgi:hypothetical protein
MFLPPVIYYFVRTYRLSFDSMLIKKYAKIKKAVWSELQTADKKQLFKKLDSV